MTLYVTVITILFLSLLSLCMVKVCVVPSANKRLLLFVFALSYLLLCGLRDSGGADDLDYRLFYENNYGGDFKKLFGSKEPIFNIIKGLGRTFGFNYKFLFLFFAILTTLFICMALGNLYDETIDLSIYISGFYIIAFSSMFTIMRQALASSILFYMYSFSELPWKKKFFFWFLIICTHYGFLILIPVEIFLSLKKYKIGWKIKIAILIICFILGYLGSLSNVLLIVTNVLNVYKYMNMSENYMEENNLGIVIFILFIIYIYSLYRTKIVEKKGYRETLKARKNSITQMLYIAIMFITMRTRWANRLCYYYLPFMPVLLVDFFNLLPLNKSCKSMLRYIFIISMGVAFVFLMKKILGCEGYCWSFKFK